MGAVVARWSGLEAKALREARRMGVREFAAHLGVNDASVSTWEKRGARAQLRYETQQILDTDLAKLDEGGLLRFQLILDELNNATPPANQNDLTLSAAEAWATSGTPDSIDRQGLGPRSAQRTESLVAAAGAVKEHASFVPPVLAVGRVRRFAQSAARVFVIKGPPGCGKTTMVGHLASELSDEADSQVHAIESWPLGQLDLALQVLRYASIAGGQDALLFLEDLAAGLRRNLLVIIDGLSSREQIHEVGRQLDLVLRQVRHTRLRFVLVMRTPPELELSAYPVLAASVHEPDPQDPGVSYRVTPWQPEQARQLWDAARKSGQSKFADLPAALRQLATMPLYLTLLLTADRAATDRPTTAFHLVDHCVQNILRRVGGDAAAVVTSLSNLALRNSDTLLPPSLNGATPSGHGIGPSLLPEELPPLVVATPIGPRFTHDVIREYFAALRITELLMQKGRSVASITALNDLADQATSSASARGTFDFVVSCLDYRDPDLAVAIALAPTVSLETTLPLMLRAATPGMAVAGIQIIQSSAARCTQRAALELARSLLATPLVASALGDAYSQWVVTLLRTFGPAVWRDMFTHLEQALTADMATQLLETADLESGEEATFFARHALLFHGHPSDKWLEALASHADWRVRAALADGLLSQPASQQRMSAPVLRQLVKDDDYKVRAAVARAVARVPGSSDHLVALIGDANWHVRANVLRGLLSISRDVPLAETAAPFVNRLIVDDESWKAAPLDAAKLRHRLLLMAGESVDEDTISRTAALFALLREIRTGWTAIPEPTLERVRAEGRRSPRWLVRRESEAIEADVASQSGSTITGSAIAGRDAFRGLRGRRAVQVALDLHDLGHALDVARVLAHAGVDFIEVGDPLIKQVGVRAIEEVKRVIGATRVVAEMMSADWGRDQVEQAAEAGADVVLLIGPATAAGVAAAVDAGRRLGTPILLDIPALHASQHWVREMEHAGVDGFTITSNIDVGVGVGHPLARARAVRRWSRLPVAVSGGFSVNDTAVLASQDWDILIVGRSITESTHPESAVDQLLKVVRSSRGK